MSRNYRFYLEDTRRMSYERFVNDRKTVTLAIKYLENIGEAARNTPESVKKRYPDIKWAEMIALRNVLVHHYFGINYQLIWATIRDDIPPLHERINQILEIEPPLITE